MAKTKEASYQYTPDDPFLSYTFNRIVCMHF